MAAQTLTIVDNRTGKLTPSSEVNRDAFKNDPSDCTNTSPSDRIMSRPLVAAYMSTGT